LLTIWQEYQIVASSKIKVQVSFSQGIFVCLTNYYYLLVLAIIKIMVWFNLKQTPHEITQLQKL